MTPVVPVSGKAGEILQSLHPDEPVFVFRAKDLLSPFALLAYRDLVDSYNPGGVHARDVNAAIVNFRAWQVANPQKVKFPD